MDKIELDQDKRVSRQPIKTAAVVQLEKVFN